MKAKIRVPFPKAPCTDMVATWAFKGLLYHDFGAYVYTIVVLGAFGFIVVPIAIKVPLYFRHVTITQANSYPSIYLNIHLYVSTYLCIYLSIYQSIYLSREREREKERKREIQREGGREGEREGERERERGPKVVIW